MSKKNKSNIIDFENEIVFTVEDKDYELGDMVHQAHNDNGIEFIFKLEEVEDDEPSIHWSWLAKEAVGWRN